jgi:hypothetical protein
MTPPRKSSTNCDAIDTIYDNSLFTVLHTEMIEKFQTDCAKSIHPAFARREMWCDEYLLMTTELMETRAFLASGKFLELRAT